MQVKGQSQRGSIYVEALVAVAILALALIPLLGAFAISPAAQKQAGQHGIALNIARERLESLHTPHPTWPAPTEVVNQGGAEYQVVTSSAERTAGLQDVTITVSWTDGKGNRQHVTLATSVARRS